MVPQMYVFPRVDELGETWYVESFGLGGVGLGFEESGKGGVVAPTPFSTVVPVEKVISRLESTNPGVMVDWFSSESEWLAG